MSVPDTRLTLFHKRVMGWLEGCGFGVMEEVDFPPYRADIYLPDFHAIVECDGPWHGRTADDRRDHYLSDTYGLPTFRVKYQEWISNPTTVSKKLADFLREVRVSKSSRWERNKDKVPWL